MLTYDDHLLLSAMESNGLTPDAGSDPRASYGPNPDDGPNPGYGLNSGINPSTGFDPNDMMSPIYSLPAVALPPNAPPIDLPSLTPGLDASPQQQLSHSGVPYSPVGSGIAPPPDPAPAPHIAAAAWAPGPNAPGATGGGPAPNGNSPDLSAQFDNSDLGIGQWPGAASYGLGSQLIGMGLGPSPSVNALSLGSSAAPLAPNGQNDPGDSGDPLGPQPVNAAATAPAIPDNGHTDTDLSGAPFSGGPWLNVLPSIAPQLDAKMSGKYRDTTAMDDTGSVKGGNNEIVNNQGSNGAFQVDPRSQGNLKGLDPHVQHAASEFLRKAKEAGITIKITSGFRSYAEQDALYAQGRSMPGPIVTNAPGGYSHHNFGLAFDVTIFKKDKHNKDQPVWNAGEYAKLAPIANSCGLQWGGNWHGLNDNDHFEWDAGLSLAQERDHHQKHLPMIAP